MNDQPPLAAAVPIEASSPLTEARELFDSRTHAHLLAAFVLDAQASQLFDRFARTAELEGMSEVARTFREIAESQAFQAQGHLDLLMRAGDPLSGEPVGGTLQNLRSALATHERELLEGLPEMAHVARDEGFHDIASWFETLSQARGRHRVRLASLLDEGEQGA